MTKIQKFKIILLGCVLSLIATPVFAAELFFDAKTTRAQIGEKFEVELFVNAEQESINAIEGQIAFPADFLELEEIRDGNSIINFWVERPRVETGKILFSGITPGGFLGENGLIFSVIFSTKSEVQGAIEIRKARVLLNDGKGTPTDVKISNFQFLISKQVPISQIPKLAIKDLESPETFRPEIAKDKTLFDGKWFIVFATQDKASGIDYYEIKESRQRILNIFKFKKWTSAESPHVLADQELRSSVWIKAVDKAGNERIIEIAPRNPLAWYENYENWSIIIILVIVAVILFWLWKNKKLKARFVNS